MNVFFKKKAVLHGGITQDRIMFIIDEQLSKNSSKNSLALFFSILKTL